MPASCCCRSRSPQAERFSAGIVALDLATGHLRWVRQLVHHDLWDMDVGGQPSLVDLDTPQGRVPALVASTKQGSIHVLDRRNGEPIVPVREVPAPQGAADGDRTSPTQPVSDLNFDPATLAESDMWGAQPSPGQCGASSEMTPLACSSRNAHAQ